MRDTGQLERPDDSDSEDDHDYSPRVPLDPPSTNLAATCLKPYNGDLFGNTDTTQGMIYFSRVRVDLPTEGTATHGRGHKHSAAHRPSDSARGSALDIGKRLFG